MGRQSDRINQLIHNMMRSYLVRQYSRKLNQIRKLHPELFKNRDVGFERSFALYWRELLPTMNPCWATLYASLSGIKDVRFVPEDVFYGIIERCLNNCDGAGGYIEDKFDANFYIPNELRPRVVIAFNRGVFFDSQLLPITESRAQSILNTFSGPVVGKPAAGTSGGSGVCLFRDFGRMKQCGETVLTTEYIEKSFESYIVQEVVRQDTTISVFNPHSLNTCRLVTFRRPWSGEVSVIAGMLRMGGGKEITDNVTRGGVCVDVDGDGKLADYGIDYRFKKINEHPISHVSFSDKIIPNYEKMSKAVCEVAARIPGFNLLGFDVVVRDTGEPCIIEINGSSISLKPQTHRPLFGEETDQVKEWCKSHLRYDNIRHLRTWY